MLYPSWVIKYDALRLFFLITLKNDAKKFLVDPLFYSTFEFRVRFLGSSYSVFSRYFYTINLDIRLHFRGNFWVQIYAGFPLDSPCPRSVRRRYYIGVYFLPSGFCKNCRSCTEYFPEILSKISHYLPLEIKTTKTRLHQAEKMFYFVRIVALVQEPSRKFCLKS